MSNEAIPIKLLGQTLQIACPPEAQPALLRAADFLEKQMQTMRERANHTISNERIAMMIALNIANEYLALQETQQNNTHLDHKINSLLEKVRVCLHNEPEEAAKALELS